jgi:acetylornithine deacetylase
MQQSILNHLEVLLRCDTQNPPRQIGVSDEIFTYINSILENAGGFKIEMTDHGDGHINYAASRGAPNVLFNVHLDTVQIGSGWTREPLALTIEDSRAYGRGVCDIKGAAAVLLAIAETTDLPLALLFSTDEEGANSCCVREFTKLIEKDDYVAVVVAEPTQ